MISRNPCSRNVCTFVSECTIASAWILTFFPAMIDVMCEDVRRRREEGDAHHDEGKEGDRLVFLALSFFLSKIQMSEPNTC